MPHAGRLDRLVVIEQATEIIDEVGQPIQVWAEFAQVWAGKRDIRGLERVAAGHEIATETTIWTMHWLDGVTPAMRLVAEGKTYDITGVAELGRRAGLELTAMAKVV